MRDWLSGKPVAFPGDWTLDAVAEECHRRYLSGRWRGGEIEASRAVVTWAAIKLATCTDFTEQHWEWIVALDQYDRADGYSRLSDILRPAVAAVPNWRQSDSQRDDTLSEMDKAASYLLKMIEPSFHLNVSLRGVAGCFPEMQPLFDHSRKLQTAEMDRGRDRARQARESGAELGAIIEASLPLDGYRAPQLSDYLYAFKAALRGTLCEARPSQDAHVYEVLDGLLPEQAEALTKRFGMTWKPVDPKGALRTGGDFGAYPNRGDALRRAVILAFPRAIYERMTAPPKVTAAAMIESACLAWFGSAPTQKEINAAIKRDRDTMEPAMMRDVVSWAKSVERRTQRTDRGLSPKEIRALEMRDFLDDADELPLSDLTKRRLSKALKASEGKKAGNPPLKK